MSRVLDTQNNYQPQEPESLLTEEQLARFLNVNPRTLTDWIQTNRIRYYRLGWRSVRFRLSDVLEFIERSAVPAKETPAPSRIARSRTKRVTVTTPLAATNDIRELQDA